MKTRRNRARWIMRCSRSPDRSPVNGIPVRSPPKRPGAIPTNATAAGAAPAPGTTRERHRTSDGHSAHSLIDARNCCKGSRRLGLRVGESVRTLSTDTVVDPMREDFSDEFAAQVAFRDLVELAPHAAAAQQVKLFLRHVRPRDAPDALRPSALFTRINQLTGCGKCRFDQAHCISKPRCIVCPRDNRHNRIDLKALAGRRIHVAHERSPHAIVERRQTRVAPYPRRRETPLR